MSAGHGICDEASKTIFYSAHEARGALTGQLRSKRVRVYRCGGHYHLTKERVTFLRSEKQKKNQALDNKKRKLSIDELSE